MLKSPRKTILKQKLFTEAEAVNCLVLRCARYCCAVGISSFVAGDTSRDSALTCAFAVAVSYLNLLPKIWIYVLTRLFNGIYRSIGIKDGQLHTWIERDWRKDHCPKISLQLSSGARGTNLALNIPDQAFVLGTSPKFALPGRYGDTGRSSNTKDGCEAVLCQLRCKVGETHDIDTVFKHCVQTLGVRHADSGLKECPGCDLELLGTDSTSNNMSWVSRYIYIYDYTDIEREREIYSLRGLKVQSLPVESLRCSPCQYRCLLETSSRL